MAEGRQMAKGGVAKAGSKRKAAVLVWHGVEWMGLSRGEKSSQRTQGDHTKNNSSTHIDEQPRRVTTAWLADNTLY